MHSMVDLNIERKRQLNSKVKTILAAAFGIMPLFMLSINYVRYDIKGYIYMISMWQIITAKGIVLEQTVINIPILLKSAVIAGVALAFLGTVFLVLNRVKLAAIFFSISAVSQLLAVLSSTEIQTSAAHIGISNIRISYLFPFTATLVLGILSAILSIWTKGTDILAESIFLVFACVSVGSVAVITIYMLVSGLPAMYEIGVFKLIFGTQWKPSKGIYGILPMILSSIVGTIGAIIIGVPVGILTAVFLSEVASTRLANIVRPAVQLLAGIPSVVYGFFGMLIIVPFIRRVFYGKTIGDSLLAVIIILAIMVLPTIISVSENALRSVPKSYREAALALGTTPTMTIFKVTLPAAKSGILAGVILGVGRAIGETMAVIMVAGNVVNMPSILGTVRMLTTGIVLEMSYSSGLHRQALFAIGFILFIFIMIVNISFTAISKKGVQMDEK